MNSEHSEYNRDTNPYPSFGKKYNSERGIISLTSWKARINTVSKTLFSLIKQCPGFHIVLVLSEEEFPKMEKELPDDLMLFVKNNLIELLWVYKNYKSFKKVLFTANKYPNTPIISADDDCIYICNYAEELYNHLYIFKKENNSNLIAIRFEYGKLPQMQGPTSLYYGLGKLKIPEELILNELYLGHSEDDIIIYKYLSENKCKFTFVHKKTKKPYYFHDIIEPMHPELKKLKCFSSAFIK